VRRLDGNVDAEDVWHSETVDLAPFASSNLVIRFNTWVSDSNEDANVDNVQIVGTPAGPIAYDGHVFNGNFYHLTSAASDWDTAENEALALGGHLVAITTPEEQAFLNEAFLVGANETAPLWIGMTKSMVGSIGDRASIDVDWSVTALGGGTRPIPEPSSLWPWSAAGASGASD